MIPTDTVFIHVSDLKRLFFRLQKRLCRIAIWAAACAFVFILFQSPQYVAKASFKHAASKKDPTAEIKNFLQSNFSQPPDESVAHVMLSRSVLTHVASERGLQAKVSKHYLPTAAALRLWDNCLAELGVELADRSSFVFRKVHFSQEQPRKLYLRFPSATLCEVLNGKKQVVWQGRVGERVEGTDFSFILEKIPENISPSRLYMLRLMPIDSVVTSLRKNLQIKPDKNEKKLFYLSYKDRDRHLAAQVLNQVMLSYRHFLKMENEEMASEQIAYLDKREKELFQKLDKELAEYASYLKRNLHENSSFKLSEERQLLDQPKRTYLTKLFEIDLGLQRFKDLYPESKKEIPQEFIGLNLEMAQRLYLKYNQQLDASRTNTRQVLFLRDQIQNPACELTSLVTVLPDPVTQQLLNQASEISIALRDANNRSDKEQARLREALDAQRLFIDRHLEETVELSNMRIKMIEEKLSLLHRTTVDLMQREKKLLEEKLRDIALRMSDFPDKWRQESQIELKKDLCVHVLQGLSQLSESKNVSHHLYQVDSRPLDFAFPPLYAKSPGLLLFPLLTALFACCVYYLGSLFYQIATGMPISYESLQAFGAPVLGKLSFRCHRPLTAISQEDLEGVRRVAAFLTRERGKVCALIGGKYPDFSPHLATLLSREGKKVLLICCTLDEVRSISEEKEQPMPTRTEEHYDLLFIKQTIEGLRRSSFRLLLTQMKESYDHVLLYSTASAVSAEALVFLEIADTLIVSSFEERQKEIFAYQELARQNRQPIAFVSYTA
jgi:hypothetical protein